MVRFNVVVDTNDLADSLGEQITAGVGQILETASMEVLSDAQRLVPVDTGLLRHSIGLLDTGETFFEIGTRSGYGQFVEFSTRFVRAQPFIRPALLRAGFRVQIAR